MRAALRNSEQTIDAALRMDLLSQGLVPRLCYALPFAVANTSFWQCQQEPRNKT